MPIQTVRSPNSTGSKPADKPNPNATKPISPGAFSDPGNIKRPSK
jgi:hypothetical protein